VKGIVHDDEQAEGAERRAVFIDRSYPSRESIMR